MTNTVLPVAIRTCGACGGSFDGDDRLAEHAVVHRLGFCAQCKRWAAWAPQCSGCGQGFEIQHEAHTELRYQFGQLVLALQDVVPHEEVKKPAKGSINLDPKFWGAEPRGIVKAAMNPLFWANMTTPDMRMAIGLLTAVAGQYGVLTEGTAKDAGTEVVMTDAAGQKWLMWKNARTGMMSVIRQLTLDPPAGGYAREALRLSEHAAEIWAGKPVKPKTARPRRKLAKVRAKARPHNDD